MRSEIRNIRVVVKYGAFGNTDAMGFWIYGKRKDGKTVPCKNETQPDGSIQIWSERHTNGPYLEEDMTEFSKDEWDRIRGAQGRDQQRLANDILEKRFGKHDDRDS